MHTPLDYRAPGTLSDVAVPSPGVPIASEIERVQSRFGSTGWVLYLFVATVAGTLVMADAVEDAVCALLVEAAAFYPIVLWARCKVLGLPLMPVYGAACIVYYALPFVAGHPATRSYAFEEKLFAAATIAGVLVTMTIVWARLGRPAPPRVTVVRTLVARRGAVATLFLCLAGAIAFQSNLIAHVISPDMEIYGVLRAVLVTLGLLSLVALSYLSGAGTLAGVPRIAFVALATVLVLYHMMSLYLVTAVQTTLAAVLGYFLGSGRMPLKLGAALLVAVTLLQAGKTDIRTKYWEESPGATTPVTLVADWLATGFDNLVSGRDAGTETVPLLQRTSLVHMLLLTQTEAPRNVPYLEGSSYSRIPLLAVPRVLWPERPSVMTTLIELNMHYGLLTMETAEATSIGWGMIAEAYANFGMLGCLGFAVAMGAWLGLVQKLAGRMTVLSARGIAGLVVMVGAVAMEASTAQYVTTLVQSLVGVWALSFATMSTRMVIA